MTDDEREIVELLTGRIRMFSLDQLTANWWQHDPQRAWRNIEAFKRLDERKLILFRHALSRPVTPLHHPLIIWEPGHAAPELPAVTHYLRERSRQPVRRTHIATATRKAAVLYGRNNSAPPFRRNQVTHDLYVSEVLLRYRANGFDVRHRWRGEDELGQSWPISVKPDALILDSMGVALRAVEFGGNYPVERLEEIHLAFSSIELAYEIW
ncbi:hypothetical protein K2X85_08460 [bacterium]|nr:hypothetical protein [bacterium]